MIILPINHKMKHVKEDVLWESYQNYKVLLLALKKQWLNAFSRRTNCGRISR